MWLMKDGCHSISHLLVSGSCMRCHTWAISAHAMGGCGHDLRQRKSTDTPHIFWHILWMSSLLQHAHMCWFCRTCLLVAQIPAVENMKRSASIGCLGADTVGMTRPAGSGTWSGSCSRIPCLRNSRRLPVLSGPRQASTNDTMQTLCAALNSRLMAGSWPQQVSQSR